MMDIGRETAATLALYGVDAEPTDEYARQCLLARRCLEAGVRFVQVNFSYPRNYWDAHGDLRNNHSSNARKVDQPIAGLADRPEGTRPARRYAGDLRHRVRPHARGAGQ